jgi:uncharacterized repeat protein (TIGR01451 family)
MKECVASKADFKSMRTLKRLSWVVLLLLLLFSSLVWVAGAQKPEGVEDLPSLPAVDPALRIKMEPALFKQLIESDGGRVPVVVEMKMTPNLEVALAESDPNRRRQAVVATLQTTAQKSQVGALALLAEREAIGRAADVRSFWIFNGLAAEADLETVSALAALPEVQIVRRDREYHITDRLEVLPGTLPDAQSVEWNIAQVRADLVWNALKVDGAGVVVANIDSGVDFLHPALNTRYRGYDPHGLHVHTCNWFDATGDGATYPVDGNGHGTHTMGTIVGGEGIGVAPGATWIAVRAFDNQGFGLESWLHAAMQWIVDPGPGCSPPDVVGNSWGSAWGGNDVFRTDVQVMRATGVFAPFAAGNDGAGSGSIDAPASYPEAFSVGAVTREDDIASFSSRGPSTWYGAELIKPEVSAPGVSVRSSLPGGAYGENDGTSMATPHVAGLAALMLQADPSLGVSQIETIIKETSLPLGAPLPNNDYGWGRIDAYAAVASVANSGTVIGVVTRASDGVPIANAMLVADPSTSEPPATTLTSSDGAYELALAPDRYTLTASAFGYSPNSRVVEVITDTRLIEDFTLDALPSGTLSGRVTDGGQPLAGVTISIADTPVTTTTDATGVYTTWLPAGSYTVTVVSSGYRVGVATDVLITAGETTTRDFDLATAPTILLVDSGAWYYSSQIDYYRQALDELRYTYDLWTVRDPIDGVPAEGDLLPYDIVFWSSPEDSPGYLDESDVLVTYLESGGSLFLSGQDVAYYDDYYPFIYAPYFRSYLKANYVTDDSEVRYLTGVPGGLFDGLTFDIGGPGGADNQFAPDEISVLASDYASSIVSYNGGGSGGQQVGQCLNYRTIYLSHGFEAITDAAARTEVISRSIAWLSGPPGAAGVELTPGDQSLVGNFGQTVTHTLRVRNLAEIGGDTDFTITPDGHTWATSIDTDHVTLGPCESALVDIAVQVPSVVEWAASDSTTVTVESVAAVAMATRETRAPAPVLLVDDDRWYNVEDHYQNALDANGVPYDVWQIPWNFSIGDVAVAPPSTTLRMYPVVVWFSAYDWYQPLTSADEERLADYLEGGGRLYYNGQDYLFRSDGPNDFARDYLGVADYTEDFTSTSVLGLIGNPIGSYSGPYDLAYPYKNFSDALTPTASADVAFVGQEGQPNAVTNIGPSRQGGDVSWRTTFFAFNPDGLSSEAVTRLMQRVTGWLSWLGSSTVTADRTIARDGDVLTYAIVLRNDGWQDMASASFTATFTSDLAPIPGSVSGGANWDPDQSAFVWSGPLAQGKSLTFTYQATVADPLPMGHVVSHTVWMGYESHSIEFDRIVATPVNLPVLSQSSFSVEPDVGEVGGLLTYTLRVRNTGVVDGLISASNPLPDSLDLIPGSLQASDSTTWTDDRVILWTVPVAVGGTATLTYTGVVTDVPPGLVLRNRATLDDGLGNTLALDALVRIDSPIFLPIIFK